MKNSKKKKGKKNKKLRIINGKNKGINKINKDTNNKKENGKIKKDKLNLRKINKIINHLMGLKDSKKQNNRTVMKVNSISISIPFNLAKLNLRQILLKKKYQSLTVTTNKSIHFHNQYIV